jgi:zinc protease
VKPGAPVTPITIPGVMLSGVQKKTITDRVQLPRLYMAWLTPASLAPGDAALDLVADVLAGGKNSRLYKRLVYDMQIAQNVVAYQNSQSLSSYFLIQATPQPGHTPEELRKVIDEEIEKLKAEPPTDHEVQRAINQIEASFYNRMERVGGFGGKADQLNRYYTDTGDPDWFNEDLARYRAISATDIRAAAQEFLPADRRVELTVVPESSQP